MSEDRVRAVVCPLCLPSGERRGGYLLPSAMLAASVEEDQAATGCACDASCVARLVCCFWRDSTIADVVEFAFN